MNKNYPKYETDSELFDSKTSMIDGHVLRELSNKSETNKKDQVPKDFNK